MSSIGTGFSISKVGEGANGFERLKADIGANDHDGLFLDGTSSGAGYIFGVIKALSQEN